MGLNKELMDIEVNCENIMKIVYKKDREKMEEVAKLILHYSIDVLDLQIEMQEQLELSYSQKSLLSQQLLIALQIAFDMGINDEINPEEVEVSKDLYKDK